MSKMRKILCENSRNFWKINNMNTKEILSHVDHTLLKATATWEQIKKIAEEESCVMVGRCADYALEEYENAIVQIEDGLVVLE